MKKSLIAIGLIAMLLVVAGCTPKTQPESDEDITTGQEGSTTTEDITSEDAGTGINEVSAEDEELTTDELSETDSELDSVEEALA